MALVIGLVGRIGAGKGEVARYLTQEYGASCFVFSQVLMDVLDALALPHDRALLQKLGTSLRAELGGDVLVNALKAKLSQADGSIVIVDGIRFPNEVNMVRGFSNNLLIAIDAALEIRHQRCLNRGTKGEGDLTLAEFNKNDNRDTEKHVEHLLKLADHEIDNSGSIAQLHEKIDEIIKPLI